MRTRNEVVLRRETIRDDLDADLPDAMEQSLRAQEEILTWILDGEVVPDELRTKGRIKFSGEAFEEILLAGRDRTGRIYPSFRTSETGEYVLGKRPSERF